MDRINRKKLQGSEVKGDLSSMLLPNPSGILHLQRTALIKKKKKKKQPPKTDTLFERFEPMSPFALRKPS